LQINHQINQPSNQSIHHNNPHAIINIMTKTNPPPSSIYEAIKNDDYEGLLSLYATTVYDAVHSAEFAHSISSDVMMPNLQRGWSDDRGEGFFFDGEFVIVDVW
jgi:hypothetical protein